MYQAGCCPKWGWHPAFMLRSGRPPFPAWQTSTDANSFCMASLTEVLGVYTIQRLFVACTHIVGLSTATSHTLPSSSQTPIPSTYLITRTAPKSLVVSISDHKPWHHIQSSSRGRYRSRSPACGCTPVPEVLPALLLLR